MIDAVCEICGATIWSEVELLLDATKGVEDHQLVAGRGLQGDRQTSPNLINSSVTVVVLTISWLFISSRICPGVTVITVTILHRESIAILIGSLRAIRFGGG